MPSAFKRAALALGLGRDHIVALQEDHLVARQQRVGQELEEKSLQPRERERNRHQQAPAPDLGEHELHQFLERLHLGPAELVGRAGLGFIFQRRNDGRGDIADEHRLKARLAAADERQRRRDPCHGGEAIEEAVLGAEQDRRPEDHGRRQRGFHRRFARGLGARIGRLRTRIGADRRYMHELGAAPGRGFGHGARALRLHALECLPAALEQDAGEIDQRIGILRRAARPIPETARSPAPHGSARPCRAAAGNWRAPAAAPRRGCANRAWRARAPDAGRGIPSRHRP